MDAKVAPPRRTGKRPPREKFPDTPDPVEIAMVAAVSGKPIPNVAKRVLEEQAELIHAQTVELRLKHVGDIVRAALWTIVAIVALSLFALLCTLLFRAAHSDELVVESFKVPPAMEQKGLTGDVIATQVLDKIAEFQATTQSVRAATSYDNNWGDDLKIDIPNTGATADQVWKLLRGWLGKETRISGEVIETGKGLALTTRVGTSPGQRFVESNGDLDGLVSKAAETVLAQTQPYRFAIYLGATGRKAQAMQALQQLTADPSPVERKWAFNGLSVFLRRDGYFRESLAAAENALRIDPKMLPALENASEANVPLGHNQAALDEQQTALEVRNDGRYDERIRQANACDDFTAAGALKPDPAMTEQAIRCYATAPESYRARLPGARINLALQRHDWALVIHYRQAPSQSVPAAFAAMFTTEAHLFELVQDGGPGLADTLKAHRDAVAQSNGQTNAYYRAAKSTEDVPLEVMALAKLGRLGEAAALAATMPSDCYDCLRARGMTAEAGGDLPQAQRCYAEAVRQGPGLAFAYVDWGKMLTRARRQQQAVALLSKAAALSPNWADPLKYWGDALAKQGKRDQALAKYDAALKLAPDWQELRQARAKAARLA